MPRPRFQFRLRTLFIVVTGFCVLFSQWPWVEWSRQPVAIMNERGGVFLILEGYPYVPTHVWVVAGLDAAALIGWLVWRRVRRPATRD